MAFGPSTLSSFGGAAQDLFSGITNSASLKIKAKGNLAEADNYDLAAGLADENAQFTKTSTELKTYQANRNLYQALGATTADVAGAGFAMSGSALDLMRDSVSQGALTRETLGQQGLIAEDGYKEQARSYRTMSAAARSAAADENDLADKSEMFGYISGGIKAAAGIATLFTGGAAAPLAVLAGGLELGNGGIGSR